MSVWLVNTLTSTAPIGLQQSACDLQLIFANNRKGIRLSVQQTFVGINCLQSAFFLKIRLVLDLIFLSDSFSPRWQNCRSKKGIKQCLGGLKCSQNTKKNKEALNVSFKAIFNLHFANLVSKEYFSIQRFIIFVPYE